MKLTLLKAIVGLVLGTGICLPALAAPTLLQEVVVSTPIVTVGDMFADAGDYSDSPLFKAPAPGTTGSVPIGAIRQAAERIGLDDFDNPGVLNVKVSRAGVQVNQSDIEAVLSKELVRRGILTAGMSIQTRFDEVLPSLFADNGDKPLTLKDLRFVTMNGRFAARFELSGIHKPVTLSGRIDVMVEVPHLVGAQPQGKVLSLSDIEMRPVLARYAEPVGIPTLTEVVGKELKRPSRDGMMLKLSDLQEPLLISRNQDVTVLYKSGPMTLTVKGRALNEAAYGQPVSVLNLMSNKVVNGVATHAGTVEITGGSKTVASL